MLLGIRGVFSSTETQAGSFYLAHSYENDPVLFQCIQTAQPSDDGSFEQMALVFDESDQSFGLESLPEMQPLVALPEVHIRVDPPAIISTHRTMGVSAGMFLVSGAEAFVVAKLGVRNWTWVNLSTGRTVERETPKRWISFSKWLLVVEENGEEVPIATFERVSTRS